MTTDHITICLVGCGKEKAKRACAATEMYMGSLTQKSLAFALKLTQPEHVYILSAKHHLLALDTVIEPYNMTLNDMNRFQRDVWGREVAQQLNAVYALLMAAEEVHQVVFLCGKNYHAPITRELWAWRKAGVAFETPLSDVGGIGYQLQYLTQELARNANQTLGQTPALPA